MFISCFLIVYGESEAWPANVPMCPTSNDSSLESETGNMYKLIANMVPVRKLAA